MQKRKALASRDVNRGAVAGAPKRGPVKAAAAKPPAPKAKPASKPAARASSTATAGGCLFFDPCAEDKQKGAAVAWINFVLGAEAPAAAAGVCCSDLAHRRWEAQRASERLYQTFARLLHSEELRPKLARLDASADEGSLRVRDPLHLGADIGLRDNVLNLLSCFSASWLRPAAEAVARERMAADAPDAAAVRRFVERRVFAAPALELKLEEGMHPAEVGRQREALGREGSNALVVKRMLHMIVLLDRACTAQLGPAGVCAFEVSAPSHTPPPQCLSRPSLAQTRLLDSMGGLPFRKSGISSNYYPLLRHLSTLYPPPLSVG